MLMKHCELITFLKSFFAKNVLQFLGHLCCNFLRFPKCWHPWRGTVSKTYHTLSEAGPVCHKEGIIFNTIDLRITIEPQIRLLGPFSLLTGNRKFMCSHVHQDTHQDTCRKQPSQSMWTCHLSSYSIQAVMFRNHLQCDYTFEGFHGRWCVT